MKSMYRLALSAALSLFAMNGCSCGGVAIVDGELKENLYTVVDGFVSCHLIRLGENQWALIDACTSEEGEAVKARLEEEGSTADDVTALFITHGHSDHVAGAIQFPNAKAYALEAELPILYGEENADSFVHNISGPKDSGIRVEEPLQDGDAVTLGNTTFEVFAMPGHTPGSAAYLVNGALFFGDAASLNDDGTLSGPRGPTSEDLELAERSLTELYERVKDRDVQTLVFSHSGHAESIEPLAQFTAQ